MLQPKKPITRPLNRTKPAKHALMEFHFFIEYSLLISALYIEKIPWNGIAYEKKDRETLAGKHNYYTFVGVI
jgi:hypothetical protein